jgi:phosphoribosyl 1,2-cyclic phosphodiesterase
MFQTSVLMSGSKGNSVLVRTDETALLLDAGVSAKTIFAALDSLEVKRDSVKAILVSHEHSDHIRGVGVVARALNIPVFINEDTFCYCRERLGKLPWEPVFFETGQSFQVGDIIVHPFSSSHDAADSCNFTFRKQEDEERKLGVATDLGYPTNLSIENLKRAPLWFWKAITTWRC